MLADKKASAGGSLMRLLNTPSLKENRRTYPQDNSHCGGSAAVADRYSYPPTRVTLGIYTFVTVDCPFGKLIRLVRSSTCWIYECIS
jgi:hypothetical protein